MGRYLKGRKMKFNFFKAAFTSLIIFSSNLANAGIINQWDIDFATLETAGNFNVNSGQGATSMTVTADPIGGDFLTLMQNSWYYLNLSDAIGENSLDLDLIDTTLSFDFKTSGTPEIGGIQISIGTNAAYSPGAFNLIGTQNWGLDNFSYDNTDIGSWVHFDINLSDALNGNFSNIMFINDCDNCSNSNVNVSFRNMTLTQVQVPVPEPSILAIFALGLMGLASRRFKKQA
jgi:hypothetical protein